MSNNFTVEYNHSLLLDRQQIQFILSYFNRWVIHIVCSIVHSERNIYNGPTPVVEYKEKNFQVEKAVTKSNSTI